MPLSEDNGFFPQPIITPQSVSYPQDSDQACQNCNSVPINTEFYNIFKKALCNSCKRSIKMVTKSTCRLVFFLNDYDLKQFKLLIRPNPHKGTWSNMNLYIEEDIIKLAIEKYGSLEEIENIKRKREEELLERKKKKMRKVVKDYKRKTILSVVKHTKHEHKFVVNGGIKKCECGLEYEEEEI